jgi:hypothetical protein
MQNEMTVYEANQDITVYRPPEMVLAEAQKAATALAKVVSGKKKPVIMNGEQYLEFEDWQTVGRFYGVTAKVVSTTFIQYDAVQGFEARAVALRADGAEISAAESMCLNDEPNWKSKPLFQLRSMAQTRACAKALRNVLAWVVVLAGYKATPAEEMTGNEFKSKAPIAEPQKEAPEGEAGKPSIKEPGAPCSEAQTKAIFAICSKLGIKDEFEIHKKASRLAGVPEPEVLDSLKKLTKQQASTVIEALSKEQGK